MTPEADCPEVLTGLTVTPAKTTAAGLTAVIKSMAHTLGVSGVAGTKALTALNQYGGIDCPSCAWPEPDDHRTVAEFCESGAKAVAWEADTRRLTPEVFAKKSIDDLGKLSDYEHGQLGRLTEPMILRPGKRHYEPIAWDEAYRVIAGELNALASPDEAIFYTSGRTSNEAAFLYQLFVRQFGTNNLPDCSNMCHESTSVALPNVIGIGKGTVTIADFEKAEVLVLMGQNPGTNHPRMLTTLQKAKRAGAKIVAVNPLREAGLLGFRNPQELRGMLGFSTPLADSFLQVKIGGDQALLKAVNKYLTASNGVNRAFIESNTVGYEAMKAKLETESWDVLTEQSGLSRSEIETFAALLAKSDRIIFCWAMGLTQHPHAVATIRELANTCLLRGSIGKTGAGLCPIRGHSNVQGDRTVGITEKPKPKFLEALGREFGFVPPSNHGYDVVEAIRAMRDGRGKVFFAMGGNFLSAVSDTRVAAAALKNTRLTVHVSIKLNRSHLVTGKTAIILPCLGRTEIDGQLCGDQFVSTENSMGVVEQSRGRLTPASPKLLSEPAIVAGLATAVLGNKSNVPWAELIADYDRIRERIEKVIPGFEHYNERIRKPGGFYLPNPPRDGTFSTPVGKAQFSSDELRTLNVAPAHLVMMTIRTHDQFNTTVYGLDDRYRGIHGERRVILMHSADLAAAGLKPGQAADITSHFQGETRTVRRFLTVEYDIPRGCCATYFPEANPLIPLDSIAAESGTPTSKWVEVSVVPHSEAA